MLTVRPDASIPRVTCSAVVADPKPLGPAHPVINEKIPILRNAPKIFNNQIIALPLFLSFLSAANKTATRQNRTDRLGVGL